MRKYYTIFRFVFKIHSNNITTEIHRCISRALLDIHQSSFGWYQEDPIEIHLNIGSGKVLVWSGKSHFLIQHWSRSKMLCDVNEPDWISNNCGFLILIVKKLYKQQPWIDIVLLEYSSLSTTRVNSLRPRQNDRQFADIIFKSLLIRVQLTICHYWFR